MNGIHCLNRSNRIHYWCYSNQWCRYIIHVYLHGNQVREKVTYKYLRLNPPGNEVDSRCMKPQSFTSKLNQREAWHLRWIFTSKRGGILVKIRCAFQIVTLKESSISNTGVNLFSLFSICQLKKVTRHK